MQHGGYWAFSVFPVFHAERVAPGHNLVLPLIPEFITPPDGAEKQDCERSAAKRWLLAHGERVKDLRPVYVGDALFSSQPMAEAMLATGADFLLVCKRDSHKTLYEYVEGVSLEQYEVTGTRQPQPDLSLPLDQQGSAARRQRCAERRLARGKHHRCQGKDHLRWRLRDQSGLDGGQRGGSYGLCAGALENRE